MSDMRSGRTPAGTETIDIGDLAAEIVDLTPTLDAGQARVAVALYRLLARGEPVPDGRLAEHLGVPVEEVSATLNALPAVHRDDGKRVVAFWGLSLGETPHRLEVEGQTVYAWCAGDSLFLPRSLGRSARVASAAPDTREPISLVVHPDGVESISPERAVLSFRLPNGKKFDDNIISNFCHHILFFPSEEGGRRWAEGREDIVILTILEGFELTRRWVDGVFGAAIGAAG
ncbi:MAG: organomercurial lyase [Actinomycetota bacterium]